MSLPRSGFAAAKHERDTEFGEKKPNRINAGARRGVEPQFAPKGPGELMSFCEEGRSPNTTVFGTPNPSCDFDLRVNQVCVRLKKVCRQLAHSDEVAR